MFDESPKRVILFSPFGLHHTPPRPIPRAAALICDEAGWSLRGTVHALSVMQGWWGKSRDSGLRVSRELVEVECFVNERADGEGFSSVAGEPQNLHVQTVAEEAHVL